MASPQPRRRRNLVDPVVQGNLLRKVALHWGFLFLANTLGLMVWVRMFEEPGTSWQATFVECLQRFLPFFVISIALIPAFVWDTLKTTNRFAGPMLRLRNALAEAARGRAVKPLHFRGDDFWQEAADHFNALMDRRREAAVPAAENPSSSASLS
jgi:hypothetical protein